MTVSQGFLGQFELRVAYAKGRYIDIKAEEVTATAKRVAAAELFQILFYGVQTTLYVLTILGYVHHRITAIVCLSLIPIQGVAYYQSMVNYPSITRKVLTLTAITTVALMAIFCLNGKIGDFTWQMSAAGFGVHIIRMFSERIDFDRKMEEERKAALESHYIGNSSAQGHRRSSM